jgi:hypothetical protein
MTDRDVFEARFHAAIRGYVGSVSSNLDAAELARGIVAAEPRRRGLTTILPWTAFTVGRLAWFLLAAVLLLAIAASVLLVGSKRTSTGWERLDLPGGGSFADIASGSAGYVAVGQDGDGAPAAWTSADCRYWTASAFDRRGSADVRIQAVGRGGPGFVAIGEAEVATGTTASRTSALAWLSADGRSWQQVTGEPFRGGEAVAYVRDVAEANGRIVAVGDAGPDPASTIPAIWTSTDGVHWQRVDPLDGSVRGYFHDMVSVVAGTLGFVAVGATDYGVPIWTSPDGVRWQRVAAWASSPASGESPSAATFSYRFGQVVLSRTGGFWALGTRHRVGGETVPSAAVSEDGTTWTPVEVPVLSDAALASTWVRSVLATDAGYVAVGAGMRNSQYPEGEISVPLRGVIWTSVDGQAWVREPGSPIAEAADLGPILRCGENLVAAGTLVDPARPTLPPMLESLPPVSEWGTFTRAEWLLADGAASLGGGASRLGPDSADAIGGMALCVWRQRRRQPHDRKSER